MYNIFMATQTTAYVSRLSSEFLTRFKNAVLSIANASEIEQSDDFQTDTHVVVERFEFELMPDVDRWIYLLDEASRTQVTLIESGRQTTITREFKKWKHTYIRHCIIE